MSVQHYVTGKFSVQLPSGEIADDTMFRGIAALYNTTWTKIKNATMGPGVDSYVWLQEHGGTQQAEDPTVTTGYHWSLTPGMVVNIPDADQSLSPVPTTVETGQPEPVAGGAAVAVGDTSNVQQAAMGGEGFFSLTNMIIIGVLIGLISMASGKKKGKVKRGRKSRRRNPCR